MLRYVLLLAVAVLPLSCASSGTSTSSRDIVDFYREDMLVFSSMNPPRCPYEEVAQLTYDGGRPGGSSPTADIQAGQERRNKWRDQVEKTFDESVADAILEGTSGGSMGGRQHIFIQFTDPDCRE